MTITELYESVGGSYDSAKRILQSDRLIGKFIVRFLDDKSCEKLLAAGETMDGAGMFEGAHALKGVCANLGLDSLSARASVIAEEFRPGNARTMDDAALKERLAEIREQHAATIAGIQKFAAEQ